MGINVHICRRSGLLGWSQVASLPACCSRKPDDGHPSEGTNRAMSPHQLKIEALRH